MQFKWFVGIDISKVTFDVTLFDKMLQKKSAHQVFDNKQKGFDAFMKWQKSQGVQTKELLICMEHTGVYGNDLAVYLANKQIAFSMVSPLHIKRSLGLTRGKNDKVDSFLIARFCYLHREELQLTKLPLIAIQKLRGLLNERERLVKMRATEKQVLKELKTQNSSTSQERIIARLAYFDNDIKLIESEIDQIIQSETTLKRNYDLIRSVIGIGMVNAVLFIIYSNNFEGFTDARKYACYGGIAPFENRSGTSLRGKTQVSHLANKRIKVNLGNGARSAVQNDPELRLYYERKAKEGKEHGVIMNAIKFKLITRVFAVVNRGTPFVKLRQAG
jgi:transposase